MNEDRAAIDAFAARMGLDPYMGGRTLDSPWGFTGGRAGMSYGPLDPSGAAQDGWSKDAAADAIGDVFTRIVDYFSKLADRYTNKDKSQPSGDQPKIIYVPVPVPTVVVVPGAKKSSSPPPDDSQASKPTKAAAEKALQKMNIPSPSDKELKPPKHGAKTGLLEVNPANKELTPEGTVGKQKDTGPHGTGPALDIKKIPSPSHPDPDVPGVPPIEKKNPIKANPAETVKETTQAGGAAK
jgi:hypothetical protein